MNRRTALTLATASLASSLLACHASAQSPADIDAVKAADAKFYATLSARDAKTMEGLWANKPSVVNIGPVSKTIAVGYTDAVAMYWTNAFTNVFAELSVTMTTTQVQTDGKVAWVIGTENATGKTKAGAPLAFATFVTNIYEKDGNRWLMVSHHAGMQPK